jgi:hypothetical protein
LLYKPINVCADVVALTPGTQFSDCKLQPLVTAPVAPGSAKAMLAYVRILRSYADALTLLATSKEPDAIGKAFGSVLSSAEALAAADPGLATAAATISKSNPPLTKLAARFAEARRLSLIRRLVRDAGPAVNEVLDRLIAARDESDGLTASASALSLAYQRMETARRSGNRAAYGAAIADYEAEHRDLQDRLASSDAGRLILIREAQGKLEARLKEPGKLTDFLELIETLKALSNALEQ